MKMQNVVFLPATEPGDETYGRIPELIEAYQGVSIRQIRYPGMVWYNEAVRMEAIAQIRAFGVSSIILIGFSKSGLGAWNITRTIPDYISGTIIFDAPVAREELPPWGTAPFYMNNESWLRDLPVRTVKEFESVVPAAHKLVLISGENFHDEMTMLAHAMSGTTVSHVFLPRPEMEHHWRSGWVEEGLNVLLGKTD